MKQPRRRMSGTTLVYLVISAALAALMAVAWTCGACAEVLKQSTASQYIVFGPMVTSGTGYTISTALTISAGDIRVTKHDGSVATCHNTSTAVSVGHGYYKKYLDDTDTAQAGNLTVTVYKSGYLRCSVKCEVLVANAYNARYTSTLQMVNATQIEGTDATDQLDAHDGNPPTAAAIWQATTRTLTGAVNVSQIEGADASDTIRDAPWQATTRTITGGTITTVPAVTLANGAHGGAAASLTLADYSNFRATGFSTHSAADVWAVATRTLTAVPPGGALEATLSAMKGATFDTATDSLEALRNRGDAAWITATSVTVSDKTGFSLSATGADAILKTSAFALAIADAIWDEALAGHATAGSAGLALSGISAAAIADAVWDEPIAGHKGAGSTGEKLSSAASAGDPWSTALPGAYAAGTAGYAIGTYLTGNAFTRLGAPTGASVSADVASILGDVATVLKLVQAGR